MNNVIHFFYFNIKKSAKPQLDIRNIHNQLTETNKNSHILITNKKHKCKISKKQLNRKSFKTRSSSITDFFQDIKIIDKKLLLEFFIFQENVNIQNIYDSSKFIVRNVEQKIHNLRQKYFKKRLHIMEEEIINHTNLSRREKKVIEKKEQVKINKEKSNYQNYKNAFTQSKDIKNENILKYKTEQKSIDEIKQLKEK
ncbi:hypothetical protein RFI_08623 [Reticulomyxa filosa]|uniref:Uncharacterized protein n=1 Tax=Reticulomyxa filosa TaxID=46433 RepID=X6NS13_RETFI|nr:hypothetical protein RFI_08623 [Reticulomyxa filosa]|eukprot:ETO28504.1 hypothetical protein RFI_08623 [Reticulomyxa filosa]